MKKKKKRFDTNNKIVKAKKIYHCSECGCPIEVGTYYRRINVQFEGIKHICLKCEEEQDWADCFDEAMNAVYENEY